VSYHPARSVGTPTSRQLPLYGNKVLALRNGTVTLHGQHKLPTWTRLARTADRGSRKIEILGNVSGTWATGKPPACSPGPWLGANLPAVRASQGFLDLCSLPEHTSLLSALLVKSDNDPAVVEGE